MNARKSRGDAVLKNLPDALQEELYQFLRKNTQDKTLDWLEEKHDIHTSAGALTGFFDWYPRSGSLRLAANFADEFKAQAAKLPQFSDDLTKLQSASEILFQIQATQDRDPKLFIELMKLSLAKKEQALSERKVKLLEAKAALAEKAEGILGDKNLTEAEQAAQVRALFGMG